jgi:hypothetical protein
MIMPRDANLNFRVKGKEYWLGYSNTSITTKSLHLN